MATLALPPGAVVIESSKFIPSSIDVLIDYPHVEGKSFLRTNQAFYVFVSNNSCLGLLDWCGMALLQVSNCKGTIVNEYRSLHYAW